jgi:peptide/nickel transport system permease protein
MLLITLTALFLILRVIPGDPVEALYGEKAPQQVLDQIRHELGLNKPLFVQYIEYMSNFFSGDLGTSLKSGKAVIYEIGRTWIVTVQYCLLTVLFTIIVGLPLGIISAFKREKVPDFVIRIASLIAFSLPVFWLGLLLQFIFGLKLGWFPLGGLHSPNLDFNANITGIALLDSLLQGNISAFADILSHLILPSITLSVQYAAVTCRISRANIIQTLDEDYIIAARAKGLREITVLYKHALRNALLPVITIWAWTFAALLGGSIIIEQIFSLPGMGSLLYTAIIYRDFPLIQGVLAFFAVITSVISVIIDIVYAILDPRIRY